jgi:general secretion pathway protein G
MKRYVSFGFTLIELLVVIAIMALVIAVSLPNFISARQRARDTRRKEEISGLKQALRLYFNDYQSYPASEMSACGTGKLNYIKGCGTDHNACCPCSSTVDFGIGSSCDTVYMKKFPSELGSSMFYYLNGDDFCLKVPLENTGDPDTKTNIVASGRYKCESACGANCSSNDYCVCAD